MSHIVESCPLTKLNGGLSRLQYYTLRMKTLFRCWPVVTVHEMQTRSTSSGLTAFNSNGTTTITCKVQIEHKQMEKCNIQNKMYVKTAINALLKNNRATNVIKEINRLIALHCILSTIMYAYRVELINILIYYGFSFQLFFYKAEMVCVYNLNV